MSQTPAPGPVTGTGNPDTPSALPDPYAPSALAASPVASGPVMERPHPLTPVVKGWVALVGIVVYQAKDFLEHGGGRPSLTGRTLLFFGGILLAYLVITSVIGYFSWRFTRFVVDDHQLRIEHNFIQHHSDQVPFTKIQSVDVVQPFAARLLGLSQIRIDVGSGKGKSIEYLTRQRAYQMRDYLVARAHGRRIGVDESAATPVAGVLQDVAAHEQVLLRVPPQRLVVAAVLSTHFLVTLLLSLAVATGMYLAHQWGVLAGLVPLATALFGFISKEVVQQWNYALVRSGQALKVSRGMTSLMSQTLPTNRIQGLVVTQHILWRPLGIHRVQMDVLGYRQGKEDQKTASDILLPAGTWDEVQAAVAAVWPGFRLDGVQLQRPSRRARWLDPLAWGWMGWGRTDEVMVARSGVFVRRTKVVHHARVQSVHLRQGPIERRLHIANAELNTSNVMGNLHAWHLDEAVARQLVLDEMDVARAARRADAERSALDALPMPGSSTPSLRQTQGPVAAPPTMAVPVGPTPRQAQGPMAGPVEATPPGS